MNEIIYHEIVQGSDEWLHFRSQHDGASEAAAMLGLSKKTTRTQLLHLKHTGITKEFSDYVQREILDYGHEVEAMARPIVSSKLGKKLYPVTLSRGSHLSASCDGLTMDESVGWEHKQYNRALFDSVSRKELPDEFMPQVQQELMVSGATSWIFTVSDGTEENLVSMDIFPDSVWFEKIKAGWEQFHKDLKDYVPVFHLEKPQAEASLELPALFVNATGKITDNNLAVFEESLTLRLAQVRSIVLVTDQDFSNAKEQAKILRAKRAEMELVKKAMLSQTVSIGEAARKIDLWMEDCRITALQLEKDVEREDTAKKSAMVSAAAVEFNQYVQSLELAIQPIQLSLTKQDFAGAIKGKRNYAAMQDAVDTALANGKIAADKMHLDISVKLDWIRDYAKNYKFLFNDLAQIITKPLEDFQLVVTSRIEKHQIDEREKLEAQRLHMEAEATAKAEREAAAKLAQEEARIRAEAVALAEAKAKQDALIASEQAATAKMFAEVKKAEDQVKAEMAKAQAEEDALVAKHCGAEAVAVNCAKPTRPTKMQLIEVVAAAFSISILTADEWLRAEFSGRAA